MTKRFLARHAIGTHGLCRNASGNALLALALCAAAAATSTALAQQPAANPLLYAGEERWLRNIRQLTRPDMGLDRSGEAYFSPDGKQICFQAYPKGQNAYQIYVMNVDGSDLKMISTGQGATTCSFFSPDGKRVIFASNHADQRPAVPGEFYVPPTTAPGSADPPVASRPATAPAPGAAPATARYQWDIFPGMDIYEYTLATGRLRQLTNADGYDAEGSYSPDGQWIVFCSMRDGDREIYIMDRNGEKPRRITRAKGYDGGPFFSPDGKRIVYRADRNGDDNMQIFTNNTEGTAEKAITGADILHWCPYWHPSGKWLIFTRADHGTKDKPKRPEYDLYLIRDDGSQLTRVTTHPKFDGLPVFSPDGAKLMWTSKRGPDDTAQVFIADFLGLTRDGELTAKTP